jgi:hypothetical protein
MHAQRALKECVQELLTVSLSRAKKDIHHWLLHKMKDQSAIDILKILSMINTKEIISQILNRMQRNQSLFEAKSLSSAMLEQ